MAAVITAPAGKILMKNSAAELDFVEAARFRGMKCLIFKSFSETNHNFNPVLEESLYSNSERSCNPIFLGRA